MGRQVKIDKMCDRCFKPTPAKQSVPFNYLGVDYELDVCEQHAQAFDRDISSWTRVARELDGPPKVFDAASAKWRELLEREDEHRRAHGGTTAPRGARLLHHGEDDDDVVTEEPPVFSEWTLTEHAKERQLERGFTHQEVMEAAVAPERVFLDPIEGRRRHMRGRVVAVVNVSHRAVLTVMFANRKDYLAHQKEHARVSA